MSYSIRDISLAPLGKKRIEWVRSYMPVLAELEKRFKAEQPFKGLRISVCVHLEAKTAYLGLLLREGGADFSRVPYFVIYLRDISDYPVIDAYMQERFPGIPRVILEARVCRPSWLIEMECETV